MRAAVAELDPALPIDSLRTFGDQMDRSTNERMLATLTSGGVGTAAVGCWLHGVMSLVATRRTQEIGLRPPSARRARLRCGSSVARHW